MVEVFKTDVSESSTAESLLQKIHENFDYCIANFDLEDCDKILRIESNGRELQPVFIIKLLDEYGYKAEVLPD